MTQPVSHRVQAVLAGKGTSQAKPSGPPGACGRGKLGGPRPGSVEPLPLAWAPNSAMACVSRARAGHAHWVATQSPPSCACGVLHKRIPEGWLPTVCVECTGSAGCGRHALRGEPHALSSVAACWQQRAVGGRPKCARSTCYMWLRLRAAPAGGRGVGRRGAPLPMIKAKAEAEAVATEGRAERWG